MRSMLFLPADSEKKIAKGEQTNADGLILDLEDSVALPRKSEARGLAREYLDAPLRPTSVSSTQYAYRSPPTRHVG